MKNRIRKKQWKKHVENAKEDGEKACIDLYSKCMHELWKSKSQRGLSEEQIRVQATQIASELGLDGIFSD